MVTADERNCLTFRRLINGFRYGQRSGNKSISGTRYELARCTEVTLERISQKEMARQTTSAMALFA